MSEVIRDMIRGKAPDSIPNATMFGRCFRPGAEGDGFERLFIHRLAITL